MEASTISDGQPYPSLFFAITLTSYFVFVLSFIKRHEVDTELLNAVQLIHVSLELKVFICARYPVIGPPSASRFGGLHVTLMELQLPRRSECKMGSCGKSVKRNESIYKKNLHT